MAPETIDTLATNAMSCLATPNRLPTLRRVAASPGLGVSRHLAWLNDDTAGARKLLIAHLDALVVSGLVRREESDGSQVYHATDQGAACLRAVASFAHQDEGVARKKRELEAVHGGL